VSAGLPVEVEMNGRPDAVAPGVDLAAYRIVQEALTNVARHAGPAHATGRISYGHQDLVLQVDDDGVGAPTNATPNGGNGILGLPGLGGLAATRTIADDKQLGAVHIVILTTFDLDEYVFEAISAGASGFLVKDTEPVELIRAVRVAASGDALLSPGATRRLIA